jgi:hypothetical protein
MAAYRQFLKVGNPVTDKPLLEKALAQLQALEGK